MYFPYLRGKQYELLAIRELINNKIIGSKICPIIEPIKLTSTLDITLKIVRDNDFTCSIIFNPQVGDLVNKSNSLEKKYVNFVNKSNILYGYIVNKKLDIDISRVRKLKNIHSTDILLIHNQPDFFDYYQKIFKESPPKYNLIPEQRTYARKIQSNKVLLIDHFNQRKRNRDYLDQVDEYFSEDHLYYKEEGYVGFADYCTIGSDYYDKGFAPYTVIIHITYFDQDNVLRIKHFGSDSNDDPSDTPRKFYEALKKLIAWKKTINFTTNALTKFENLFNTQSYPGLGTLKKLSVMHHLELMNKYLEEHDLCIAA